VSLAGTIKIVGCGLIGTSIALRLKEEGFGLILADSDARNLELATDLLDNSESKEEPGLIVIATPPGYVYEVALTEFAAHPDAIFIDVSGIKSKLMNKVEGFSEMARRRKCINSDRLGAKEAIRSRYLRRHPIGQLPYSR
jgi:prephenate dehydrogenase